MEWTDAEKRRKKIKKMRARAGFLRVVGSIIMLFVLLTYLPLSMPHLLGFEIYTVISGSMEPTYPVGSIVYVKSTIPESIQVQDVISYQSGDSIITHRVMENRVVEGEFITKGDANTASDINPVAYSQLIGVVKLHIPLLGVLSDVYTSMLGKVYAFGFLIAAVMMHLLANRFGEIAQEEEKKESP